MGGMRGKRGVCGEGGSVRGWRDGHCNGQYASYWNASLFIIMVKLSSEFSVQTIYYLWSMWTNVNQELEFQSNNFTLDPRFCPPLSPPKSRIQKYLVSLPNNLPVIPYGQLWGKT